MIGGLFQNDQGATLIKKVMRTESAWERMRGLLGRPVLHQSEALWITPGNSVHSLFMTYPIDLIYLDRQLRVIKIIAGMNPWRLSAGWGSHSVIELISGSLKTLEISVGSQLVWQPCAR